MADSKPLYGYGEWNKSTHLDAMERIMTILTTTKLSPARLALARGVLEGEVVPTLGDVLSINGHDYPKWEIAADTELLTAAGLAAFRKELDEVQKRVAANKTKERGLLSQILQLVSPEMKQNLYNLAGARVALDSHDLFLVWPFLLRAARPPGAANSMRSFTSLVHVSQSGELASFPKFALHFKRLLEEFSVLFEEPAHPGCVRSSTLGAVCLLNSISHGVDREGLKFLLDKVLADIATVHDLESAEALITKFQSFHLNTVSRAEEPVIGYYARAEPPPGRGSRAPAAAAPAAPKKYIAFRHQLFNTKSIPVT